MLNADEIATGLLDWVALESPSSSADAVNRLVDLVASQFAPLATDMERIAGVDGRGDHLVVRSGPGAGVLVLCHLDTVHPLGSLAARPIRREGDRLYGPGVYDMKGGAYIAYLAFKTLRESEAFRLPVSVLFTSDEEVGSPTSRHLVEDLARAARHVLVLEPARAGGKAVTKRFGIAHYRFVARGRAAHAGVDPERGRSAISELALQVARIDRMRSLEDEIITNVGLIEGGTAINTVAARATMSVEVRFADPGRGLAVCEAIAGATPLTPDVALEVTGGVNRPPFVRDEKQAALFRVARAAAQECGFALGETETGGGSDASFAQSSGAPTLCGLGVEGGGAHSPTEHILVSRLPARLCFLTRLIARLR